MITVYLIGSRSLTSNKKTQKRDALGRFVADVPALATKPKTPAIEKNPLVSFTYPSSTMPGYVRTRVVRVISSTFHYLTGLEQQPEAKWQYKKYCQSKIVNLRLFFNKEAMR